MLKTVYFKEAKPLHVQKLAEVLQVLKSLLEHLLLNLV